MCCKIWSGKLLTSATLIIKYYNRNYLKLPARIFYYKKEYDIVFFSKIEL